ncbi:MAG: hypothetical protein NTZ79_08585 [Proteobacteria bacterium]|nr:hypothetical protein [Pseudomonadota bacterium]
MSNHSTDRDRRADLAAGVLMVAMLGGALALIFMILDAVQGHWSGLKLAALLLAAVVAVAGGILAHSRVDALRAALNGLLVAAIYLTVYFLDALLESPASRHTGTVLWAAGSGAALLLVVALISRLPPPASADDPP